MNAHLGEGEMLVGETVLGEIPYRPFSVLVVTNKRIVGKRLIRLGRTSFEGSIFFGNIIKAEFRLGRRYLTTPSLEITYRDLSGTTNRFLIRFPGFTAGIAGFDPAKIYRLILEQMGQPKDNRPA